jgi:hypothetical protein
MRTLVLQASIKLSLAASEPGGLTGNGRKMRLIDRRGKMVWLKNLRASIEEGNGWQSANPQYPRLRP